MSKVSVTLFDTTLRDGAQSLPDHNQFKEGSKVDLAGSIARLGAGVIEAGFPATPADSLEVAKVAGSVGKTEYTAQSWLDGELVGEVTSTPVVAGLSRTKSDDIDATWCAIKSALQPRIHTFVSTSDFHREKKFPGVSRYELLAMGVEAVRYAREVSVGHSGTSVEFSAEAASTTELSYLEQIVKAVVRAGADVINLPDTVGERDPAWMHSFYTQAIEWVMDVNPRVVVSAHNHNDLGNACANSIALVRAASEYATGTGQEVAIQVESTICGLGERAGNADVFSVAANLFKFARELEASIEWRMNPGRSVQVAHDVMAAAQLGVNRQAPVVGRDTNVHRSGIHSDGVVKGGHSMYTPFDPTFWGHADHAVHEDGKYQGRTGKAAAKSRAI